MYTFVNLLYMYIYNTILKGVILFSEMFLAHYVCLCYYENLQWSEMRKKIDRVIL